MNRKNLSSDSTAPLPPFKWQGTPISVDQSTAVLKALLLDLNQPLFVLKINSHILLETGGHLLDAATDLVGSPCLGVINPLHPGQLGAASFRRDYGLNFAYYAGAMANGINSEAMVIALGKHKILSSFGAGGLSIERVERAIDKIKGELPNGPFAINLLHNPGHPDWEMSCVKLFLRENVHVVEASAYINLSPAIVYYRVAGLEEGNSGEIIRNNRIIAKVSRPEVARQFMRPAPEKMLDKLLKKGLISETQRQLARKVPLADDITVESDSGGHTDNGVLSCIFPAMLSLRNQIQDEYSYSQQIRIGAAGGIGSPEAVLAAFAMGAAYVVTGSVNQACLEAGTSDNVKALLVNADMADMMATPSADMFEIGAKVQVLKSKTMYGIRAQKLYNLYKQFDSLEAIPQSERELLETQFFRQPIAQVWEETLDFFKERGLQEQIVAAEKKPKKKMALIFQWYLGQSSSWAIAGNDERLIDYQIWCGPAMGACNKWLAGSYLEKERKVSDIALHLMYGAAYLSRVNELKGLGVEVSADLAAYIPGNLNNLTTQINANADTDTDKYSTKQTIGDDQAMNKTTDTKLDIKKSKEYYKKTWDLLPGGAHYNFSDPERALVIPFNKGRNSRVWDLDGNEHLDLFCKFGALFVGHHNEQYNESLLKYMEKVTSVDTCDLEYDVCSSMIKHIPCAEMVRFGLSGTEAVQNALRLARAFSGKNRFIRFHGHYHGNADNIMGGRKKKDLDFPVPEEFKGDMLGTEGRATNILENQSFLLPWNEYDILEETINKYGDEIGAVLMEPICINGGGILPRPGYLEKTKKLCEKHNIVLIFDEIITGVRLGLGGAQKILGVTPHLATFGKALAGGSMPVSAIAGRKDIMDYYTRGKVIHAGTFNGYPLGLAAVKATFDLVENDPGCYERMGAVMSKISNVFIKAAQSVDIPMVVQGMPTALVYHSQATLVDKTEGYSDKVKFCDIIIREISKRYGIQFSPLSRLYPNLLISDDDVTFFEDRIFDAMKQARRIIDITFKEGELA